MKTRRLSLMLGLFSVLSIAYILLVLLLPPNLPTVRTYHLSVIEYRVLALLLGVPRVIVWFAAFYGYSKLHIYAHTIRRTRDGAAFGKIADGLRWLAWGLPIGSIVTQIAGGIAHAFPSFFTAGILINHFTNLIIALIAFSFISSGTRLLLVSAKKQIPLLAIRCMMLAFVGIAIGYCYATLNSSVVSKSGPYHLPVWFILLTTVIPYLYAWMMGLFASYEISLYRRYSTGIFYQRALNLLAMGLGLAIISSIVLQYVVSASDYLRRIQLDWSLLIVYISLVIYAAGFALIAMGAAKLKKIEEV